ncbi:MAG: hypothetical protein IKC63_08295 [Clostridia bacterium]|nr:hypothetical protein [Clostridia bacterium]
MKNKTYALTFGISAFVLAVVMAVLYAVVYIGCYDFSTSLWQNGTSWLVKALPYICLIPVLLLGVGCLVTLKRAQAEEDRKATPFVSSLFVRIAALIVAILLAVTVGVQFLANGSSDRLGAILDEYSREYMSLTSLLHIVTLVLALPAAAYFVSVFLKKKETVALLLFVISYVIAYTLRVYFDMPQHINNPRWSFGVVTLAAILLYVTLETHRVIKEKCLTAYLLSGFAAMTLSLMESLSDLIFAIGFYTEASYFLAYSLLKLSLAVYIASRLLMLIRSLSKAPLPESGDLSVLPETPETPETPAVSGDTDTSVEIEMLPEDATETYELTQEELKRFYAAVYTIVANKRGVGENASEEEKAAVRGDTMALISKLFDGGSREENIAHMREFLRVYEESGE